MSRMRVIALVAVLLLTVPLAGCLQAEDGPDEDRPLHSAAVDDMADAESFTMTMESNTTAVLDAQTVEQRMTAEGTVDRSEREMLLEQELEGVQAIGDGTITTVVLDDSAYVDAGERWRTAPLPTNPWEQPGAQGNVQLLEEANVTRVGTETVGGVETAVLEVDAAPEAIEDAASEQLGGAGGVLDAVTVENATVHQYVAVEEPHYVHGVDVETTMTVDAGEGQSGTVEVEQTIRYDDFDEDVSVDVPDEVRELHEG